MQSATVLMAAVEMGGYVSLLKLVPPLIVLFVWAKLLTWADKDTVAAHLPREGLNTGLYGALLVGFALFFLLPHFWIAFGALLFMFLGSIGTYLLLRNQTVGLSDLKKEMGNMFASGKKKKAEVKPGEVQFFRENGAAIAAPEAEAPDRVGYDTAQTFMTEPLRKDAERVEVRPADGGMSMQYVVDGVSYAVPGVGREAGAAGITFLKMAAALEVEDRRKPQIGNLRATLDGKRHDLEVATAGSTAGESMRVTIDPRKRFEHRIDTMGFLNDQLEALRAWVAEPRGIILVSAPRQQGLTTMLYSILRAHDAYLRHIHTIEHGPKEDLEGITQNRLTTASPVEELKLVQWVASQQPDVLMMDEITNAQCARELIEFAGEGEGKRVYIGLRAGSTFDALNVWRKLVGDDARAMQQLGLIICGRVLRRLCQACKVGYAPDPDTLRKLNMDPARVTQLFQARTTPIVDQKGRPVPCTFCQELHYKGRFGIYELLAVDSEVQQAVAAGGSATQLKTAFRKQHGRYLQEVALAHVEAGETSVQEVLRVLRGPESSPPQQRQAQAQAR